MGVSLEDVGIAVLRQVVTRYKSAEMRPYQQRCNFGEHNVHKFVNLGHSTDVIGGANVLADALIKQKVDRFAEMPDHVKYKAVVRVMTDITSGVSVRVILTENGIMIDAAGIGVPTEKPMRFH